MIRLLLPSRYLDEVYAKGIHVVLLHTGDRLFKKSLVELDLLDRRLNDKEQIYLWECKIKTEADCIAVQACRYPQVRFFINGSEKRSRLGVMSSKELLDQIHILENL